jgi:hypothetical protein
MITGLFLSPDHTEVAVEVDGGDGGLVILDPYGGRARDVDEIPSDWFTAYEESGS